MAETAAPVMGGALALSPAAVGGRRHKLRLVTKKVARKALKKLGLKMRGGDAAPAADAQKPVVVPEAVAKMGGADMETAPVFPPAAGRRHRKTRKGGRKSRRRIFGY